jgi:hypothetical protein
MPDRDCRRLREVPRVSRLPVEECPRRRAEGRAARAAGRPTEAGGEAPMMRAIAAAIAVSLAAPAPGCAELP